MIAKMIAPLNIRSLPSRRMMVLKEVRKNRSQHTISGEFKQLLVDVSIIIDKDAHTGIQRVVRSLLLQLFSHPPIGYKVLPIFCTHQDGYKYAHHTFVEKFSSQYDIPSGDVVVGKKDIFFALDFVVHLLPLHKAQLLDWKKNGVKIYTLVYDLLPHLHPQWFTSRSVKNFRRWLRTISIYSDQLICISKSVKNEMREWLMSEGFSTHTPRIATIPMGSDIVWSLPSRGADTETTALIERLKNQKFILMVGTIEPRKGYSDALDAMEVLWENYDQTSLVIVGKKGWKTIKLQERLLTHKQVGKKLFWLSDVSDEVLEKLYIESFGILMASYGEGFGLPLVEAMFYNKKILVRNLQIFNEILEKYHKATFFNTALPIVLKNWLQTNEEISQETYELNPFRWDESSKIMLRILNVA